LFLPVSTTELQDLGWERPDILLITGDAYVDHPSFAAAILGKYLLAKGFKVAILPQPDLKTTPDLRFSPKLFVGIVPGGVDSMIANYTANKKLRSDDSFSEGGKAGKRPDRAVIQYTGFARKHFKQTPVIIGGIESSLRRFVHYDYWSEKVRNGILFDSKADFLVYGQGEETIVNLAKLLESKASLAELRSLPGIAYILNEKDDYNYKAPFPQSEFITLPAFEEIKLAKDSFLLSHKLIHENNNPYMQKGFIQRFGKRSQIFNPPHLPLKDGELDRYYDLAYERKPHPIYQEAIPAFEMIKNSVNIHRGCFGGCSFCAIALSQGKFIQSRSLDSIKKEVKSIKSKSLTDLGGPSANMYKMQGKNQKLCQKCKRLSCLYPEICPNLDTSHKEVLKLYAEIRKIKRFFVNSGIRHELALCDPGYIKDIATYHTSGILKIAPEHTEEEVLDLMYKPGVRSFEQFIALFKKFTPKDRKQFIVPYLIASFPGCTVEIMKKMMNYLRRHKIRIEQVQDFIPTPLSIASVYYYCGKDLSGKAIHVPHKGRERRIHRALMQYYKKSNQQFLRKEKII
jgi:uncharacterized radical SAM protein YgiQ